MKKNILLIVITFSFLRISAQNCNRSVTSFSMLPGGYTINGSALLERQIDNSLKLSFSSNFSTAAGPDLHVYLTTMNDAPTMLGNTHHEIAPLISNSGAQSYTLSNVIGLNQFNYVVIHCKQHNHVWGGGLLELQMGNCLTTSLTNINKSSEEVKIFPNPTSGSQSISITNIKSNSAVYFYNISGELIDYKENLLPNEAYNLEKFSNGIYFLKLVTNYETVTKKIVVNN